MTTVWLANSLYATYVAKEQMNVCVGVTMTEVGKMQPVEFETTIEVDEIPIEVYVTAEFHPATPQTEVDNTGTPQAVFLDTVTDDRNTNVKQFLGDIELDALKDEVLEHINYN